MAKRIKGLGLPTRKKEYRLTYKDGSQETILSKITLVGRMCKKNLLKIESQVFGLRFDSTKEPRFYRVIKEEWTDVTDSIKKEYEYLCNKN